MVQIQKALSVCFYGGKSYGKKKLGIRRGKRMLYKDSSKKLVWYFSFVPPLYLFSHSLSIW